LCRNSLLSASQRCCSTLHDGARLLRALRRQALRARHDVVTHSAEQQRLQHEAEEQVIGDQDAHAHPLPSHAEGESEGCHECLPLRLRGVKGCAVPGIGELVVGDGVHGPEEGRDVEQPDEEGGYLVAHHEEAARGQTDSREHGARDHGELFAGRAVAEAAVHDADAEVHAQHHEAEEQPARHVRCRCGVHRMRLAGR